MQHQDIIIMLQIRFSKIRVILWQMTCQFDCIMVEVINCYDGTSKFHVSPLKQYKESNIIVFNDYSCMTRLIKQSHKCWFKGPCPPGKDNKAMITSSINWSPMYRKPLSTYTWHIGTSFFAICYLLRAMLWHSLFSSKRSFQFHVIYHWFSFCSVHTKKPVKHK